jgi:high-affinity iron transporter
MLETMLITFREGLEAFLIVAITLAYLSKTGRKHLNGAVYAGIVAALLVSATTGWHIAEAADTPMMEGALSMVAGVMVASLTFYIMKTAPRIRNAINEKIESHAGKPTPMAIAGLFIFTLLMISREGMETALMLGAVSKQVEAQPMIMGAGLGILLTAGIAFMWVRHSHLINLKLFMQVTGIFLFLFAVHLFLYGVYELTEVEGSIFYNEALHQFIKPVASSKTPFGQAIIYGLLILPCGWLFIAYMRNKFKPVAMTATE